MPKGFIYIITSITNDYSQENFCNVPTELDGRLYFGPCKRAMRPKMRTGDYIFGISKSNPKPRRIVFYTQIVDKISFEVAFKRFPSLRGPAGPIHVKPLNRVGYPFPDCKYKHIKRAMHSDDWRQDIATPALDAFFIGSKGNRWLGKFGPEINNKILFFLRRCSVHNKTGLLRKENTDATSNIPISYGKLYIGLHLETESPQELLKLCNIYLSSNPPQFDELETALPKKHISRKCSSY